MHAPMTGRSPIVQPMIEPLDVRREDGARCVAGRFSTIRSLSGLRRCLRQMRRPTLRATLPLEAGGRRCMMDGLTGYGVCAEGRRCKGERCSRSLPRPHPPAERLRESSFKAGYLRSTTDAYANVGWLAGVARSRLQIMSWDNAALLSMSDDGLRSKGGGGRPDRDCGRNGRKVKLRLCSCVTGSSGQC